MKLAALPKLNDRTAFKIFALVIIQTFIPLIVYRLVFQTDIQPNPSAYMFAMMGLGVAAYRINNVPYWQNVLLTVIITFVAISIGVAGTIYL